MTARRPEDLVQSPVKRCARMKEGTGVPVLEDVPQRRNTEIGRRAGTKDDDRIRHNAMDYSGPILTLTPSQRVKAGALGLRNSSETEVEIVSPLAPSIPVSATNSS